MTRGARRVRRYRLVALFAWRGAGQVRRHSYLGLLAWRGWRLYVRRRRMALRLAFGAAVALAGLAAARASRRSAGALPAGPPGPGESARLTAGSP